MTFNLIFQYPFWPSAHLFSTLHAKWIYRIQIWLCCLSPSLKVFNDFLLLQNKVKKKKKLLKHGCKDLHNLSLPILQPSLCLSLSLCTWPLFLIYHVPSSYRAFEPAVPTPSNVLSIPPPVTSAPLSQLQGSLLKPSWSGQIPISWLSEHSAFILFVLLTAFLFCIVAMVI